MENVTAAQVKDALERVIASFQTVLYEDDEQFLENMKTKNLEGDDIRRYQHWEWTQGVGLYGFWRLFEATKKPEYLDMKICIGSPKSKTPMLQSRIERVDMNPYWNIPYSIVKKEIAPRHAGNEAYFSRNRYRIFSKETGEELPPAAVTADMLTSGRYRVRQDNGEGNSLGRLIFRFPNNFSIYLHDTNNKQAFKRTNRAISHGCIRIEKPLELAVFLLDTPEEKTVNRLREAIGLPPLNSSIPIEKKEGEPLKVGIQRFDPSIPVVIDYYTLYPKPDGGWEESPDPYGYDEILLKKLEAF